MPKTFSLCTCNEQFKHMEFKGSLVVFVLREEVCLVGGLFPPSKFFGRWRGGILNLLTQLVVF